ncbi:unnamed protein product (macronuclear) [Paramecium tetraurelia]|uniref:G domain-containing protein n=1 Tax=Paramecium tetraurelia TaxID=5888 RepID=A0E2C9_PARTE|nr:uncharacterized protein GSPATT00022618001 [Paramecium tetraurelia]CAK89446.1 unnamed protein product [Paramecium tetraurelia]|eukprot:XP_001456843.1 hypothetical protein (macronuclear) [Paramecium tetraurelia strain d4-2]
MDQNEYQLEMKKLFEEVELRFDSSFEKINDQINSIICDLENNLDQNLKCNYTESIVHQQDIILPLSNLPDVHNEQLSLELISLTKLYKEYQVNQVKISFNQQLEKQASLQQQQIDKLEKEKRQLEDIIKSKDRQLQSKNSGIEQLQSQLKQQQQIEKCEMEKTQLAISRKQNKSQIVLIGFPGSGKTKLYNLICQTKQPKSLSLSIREAFLKKAAYGSGFQVLYIPDYGSCQEIIINAVCTLNAALEGPIHQILLVVRAERVEIIQEYLKTMIVKFRRYRHLVTVAVTHWDTNETETTKKANEELIIKLSKNFGINSVIFVSKFDTGEKVCAQIDSILNKCQS